MSRCDLSNAFDKKVENALKLGKIFPFALFLSVVLFALNLFGSFIGADTIFVIILLVIAEVFSVSFIIAYIVIVKKVSTVLQMFDQCDISYEEALHDLEDVTMLSDGIGYSEKFFILPKTTPIPFENILSVSVVNDIWETVVYISGRYSNFSMRIWGSGKDWAIRSTLEHNREKLPHNFETKVSSADYSD